MSVALALAILLTLVLVARRAFLRKRASHVSAYRLVARAQGRTVIVGEHHADRAARDEILRLIRVAHENGYRTLGVEVCVESVAEHSGLAEELEALARLGDADIPERDARSSLDADDAGPAPRMNRQWQMREALRLGWRVVPFDPHHWNWRAGTAHGYLASREPAMADAISAHGPMIAVCGYGHLGGLEAILGSEAVYAVASEVRATDARDETFWTDRFAAAAALPRLRSTQSENRS